MVPVSAAAISAFQRKETCDLQICVCVYVYMYVSTCVCVHTHVYTNLYMFT